MTIKIEICPECSKQPLIHNPSERHYYCQHNGSLISESIETGKKQGFTDVLPAEVAPLIKQQMVFALAYQQVAKEIKESSN